MEIKTVKVSSEIGKKFKKPVPEMVLDLYHSSPHACVCGKLQLHGEMTKNGIDVT